MPKQSRGLSTIIFLGFLLSRSVFSIPAENTTYSDKPTFCATGGFMYQEFRIAPNDSSYKINISGSTFLGPDRLRLPITETLIRGQFEFDIPKAACSFDFTNDVMGCSFWGEGQIHIKGKLSEGKSEIDEKIDTKMINLSFDRVIRNGMHFYAGGPIFRNNEEVVVSLVALPKMESKKPIRAQVKFKSSCTL